MLFHPAGVNVVKPVCPQNAVFHADVDRLVSPAPADLMPTLPMA